MKIVSNTSPLSNLAVVGELDLLQQIYPKILVPPVVQAELMQFSEIRPAIATMLASGSLEVRDSQDLQLICALEQTLDPGEAAAIALATELKADRLLIDERLGRRIAMQHGLKVRGILGIIVNAKNEGLLPVAKPLLDRLINEAGFRVSQVLYERTLQEAGE
ncbi:MAG: DUF3368 domain-containing protein [Tildeniella torsiva UHER 1998/13D]|jgi:hypothetical protein|nr:DUF3368 domain-containing protein [Tildeniella torsiva UHER 1998/13D]